MSNSNVVTKLLGENDAPVLDDVADDVFDNPIIRERATQFLNQQHNLLAVAISGTTVIGMASAFVYLHPDKPLQLFVNEVGISIPFQRQGIAKRLVQLLLDRARQEGCEEAWVATDEDNVPARSLFTTLGGDEDPTHAVVYTYKL